MTYELASLDLSTSFDADPVPLAVPGTVGRGDDPALVLLDGASRGAHRLARLRRQEALAGIDVEVTGRPLRVTVVLLVDDHATRLWRLAQGLDATAHPHEEAFHRVVRLAVAGRPRAVALLHRRTEDERGCLQRLTVEVAPDEVGPGGLLTLGFDVPEHLPSWTRRRLLPDGLTGVCVARVKVEALERPVRAGTSTGRSPDTSRPDRRSLVPRHPGGFAANPGSGESLRLVLSPRAVAERPTPQGPVPLATRAREPLARLRDRLQSDLVRRSGEVHVEVTRVSDGGTRTLRLPLRPDGSALLELDPADGPVLCRPRLGGPGRAPAAAVADWHVRAAGGRVPIEPVP